MRTILSHVGSAVRTILSLVADHLGVTPARGPHGEPYGFIGVTSGHLRLGVIFAPNAPGPQDVRTVMYD